MKEIKGYRSLNEAIREIFGEGVSMESMQPVSGGDINEAYGCRLSDGSRLFMKSNRKENLDFFRKEAAGLSAIQDTGTIKTPEVLGYGEDTDRSFLLLSYIESGRRTSSFYENFGRRLALLHSAPTDAYNLSGRFGFIHDNYIGAGYQVNDPRQTWVEFFRDCRLRPQFKRAEGYFDKSMIKKTILLMDNLDSFLIEPDAPSLLHGDLWSGNYMTGPDGEAWLIDPAVYIGHAEADIAMTELFGGFSSAFYASYNEARPMAPGYEERKELYNLYHLLNHLNLFGAGYLYSVQGILNRYT